MINIVGGRTSTLKRGRDYFSKETTIKWYYRLLSLIYLHPSKNNGGWGGDPLLHNTKESSLICEGTTSMTIFAIYNKSKFKIIFFFSFTNEGQL